MTLSLFIAFLALASTPSAGTAAECSGIAAAENPRLELRTSLGTIAIELNPQASPSVVAELVRLASQPVSERDTSAVPGANSGGPSFDFTRPHLEIRTSLVAGQPKLELPTEIDAAALGLDTRLIKTSSEAASVLQQELLKAHRATKKAGEQNAQLRSWVDQWRESYSADFLIGVSRMQINQALGHVYTDGLDSKPVRRGSVALVPVSANRATPRLSIALTDFERRTGRWMVVGEVVEGLEIAKSISRRTLLGQGTPKVKEFKPLDPVLIESLIVKHATAAPAAKGESS